jgi:hypothetical protein
MVDKICPYLEKKMDDGMIHQMGCSAMTEICDLVNKLVGTYEGSMGLKSIYGGVCCGENYPACKTYRALEQSKAVPTDLERGIFPL